MTRPNRYPYTRSQWEETTLMHCLDNTCFKFKAKRNKLTGEYIE